MDVRVIPFLKYRYAAIAVSVVLFAILLVIAAGRGGLRMGVDFVGGQKIIASFENGVDEAAIRKALKQFNPLVQQVGNPDENQYIISTKLTEDSVFLAADRITESLEKAYPRAEIVRDKAIIILLKDAAGEAAVAKALAGFDAGVQRIGDASKNLFVVYPIQTPAKKKIKYNSDDIVSHIRSVFKEADVPSSIALLVSFPTEVKTESVARLLKKFNVSIVPIPDTGKPTLLVYRIAMDEAERISAEITKHFAGAKVLSVENVGPAVGSYLRGSALKLILVSLLLMSFYLAYRFEIRYSIGAMAALIHDVTLSVAFCGAAGIELNIPIIAGLLTIFGYSVNDTIVIFDRIRESTQIMTKMSFVEIINRSVTETMSRTILTTLLTLFTVFALFLIGGEGINDFAKVLLFGMIVGTYSTVYIASPVVLGWEWLIKKIRS